MSEVLDCPHCGDRAFRAASDKLKARTSMVVIHKSGAIEMNCGKCGKGILLPLQIAEGSFALRKADVKPRLVVGTSLDTRRVGKS